MARTEALRLIVNCRHIPRGLCAECTDALLSRAERAEQEIADLRGQLNSLGGSCRTCGKPSHTVPPTCCERCYHYGATEEIADLRATLESIALVTGYTEPLPGSLVGHVKVVISDLLAKLRQLEQSEARVRELEEALESVDEAADFAYGALRDAVVDMLDKPAGYAVIRMIQDARAKARAALTPRGESSATSR